MCWMKKLIMYISSSNNSSGLEIDIDGLVDMNNR